LLLVNVVPLLEISFDVLKVRKYFYRDKTTGSLKFQNLIIILLSFKNVNSSIVFFKKKKREFNNKISSNRSVELFV
jgi:hypothetical protein